MCCGKESALFLTNDGMVYSFGLDSGHVGILGLGEIYETQVPKPLDNLVDFTIKSISMSENHACATDQRGRLYTWG